MKLSDTYKIETARALTELAIQHNLVDNYGDEARTAQAICKFFKTVCNNLDSEE